MKYAIGIEAEGKYKGTKTLFVFGSGDLDKIIRYVKIYNEIEQIYFGAFYQSKIIDWEVIRFCRNMFDNFIISVELNLEEYKTIPLDILKDESILKILTLKNIYAKNLCLKIENIDFVYCYHSPDINDYEAYKDDKEIE